MGEEEIAKVLGIKANDKVLDVGGSMKQLSTINVHREWKSELSVGAGDISAHAGCGLGEFGRDQY